MRKHYERFKDLPVSAVFSYNGTQYHKRSTRTAEIVKPERFNRRWFYFGQNDVCTVTARDHTGMYFRTFEDGQAIALWLYPAGGGFISSYQTIGQHSSACRSLIKTLPPAAPDQVAWLKAELAQVGYTPFAL